MPGAAFAFHLTNQSTNYRSEPLALDPLFANRISLIHNGQAGQGAGRGPGVRPTIFAGRPVMGKTSGVKRLAACPTILRPARLQQAVLTFTPNRSNRPRVL